MVVLSDAVSVQSTRQNSIDKGDRNASMLVFIDAGVESAQFLTEGIISGAKAFILDRDRDGIEQITEIIRNYDRVDSVHLVSHGSPGSLQLGNTYLSLDTLAEYQSELKTWITPLCKGGRGNLLIYGCNAAAGDAGEEFVNKLHLLTGANIAASTTKTGNSAKDGNWDLEVERGQVKAKLAFTPKTINTYTGILEAPVLATSETGEYTKDTTAQVIAPDLTVTDADEGAALDGAIVLISSNFNAQEDSLGIAGQSGTNRGEVNGIGWNYNAETGVLNLTGTASVETYQEVLRQVTYQNSNTTPEQQERSFDFNLGTTLANPGNGHFYEYVTLTESITWTQARDAAASQSLFEQQGYLATITSQTEQDFVNSEIEGVGWIGASDEAVEGEWRWVTGPEAGTQFWSGDSSGSAVEGEFSSWNSDEPDNLNDEDYAYTSPNGTWIDWPNSIALADGYVVEYGGMEGDPDLQISSTVSLNLVDPNNPPTLGAIDGGTTNEDADVLTINLLEGASDADEDPLTIVEGATATSTNEGREVIFVTDRAGEFILDPNQFNDLADGESETITVEYEVSDGRDIVSNTATFVVEGRDDAPVLITSETGEYLNDSNARVIDADLTVADTDEGATLDGASVAISSNFNAEEDLLGIQGQDGTSGISGIDWNYNAETGVLDLSGTAPVETYQEVLQQVTYQNSNPRPEQQERSFDFNVDTIRSNPENGHFYEYVADPNISWTDALDAAATQNFFGQQGYLATITSEAEQAFVESKIEGLAWIGASDSAVEGEWRWVTGPEADTQFWSGNQSGSAVENNYNNWQPDQPSNFGDSEDYAHLQENGEWNDTANANSNGISGIDGYIVEYGPIEDEANLQISSTTTLNLINVNIPPTVSGTIDGGTISEDAENLTINLLEGASDADEDSLSVVDATATSTNEGREVVFEINETGELSLDPNQFDDLAVGESETVTVEYNVSDGTDSVPNTATFVVEGVNNAPINTLPESVTVAEDTPLEFTGDNLIAVDDADGNLEITEIRVREGVLSVDADLEEGATIEGNDSTEITLEGTQDQINNTLATLQHSSEPNFNSRPISLTITSFDDLGIGDTDQILINTTAVNDEPTLDNPIDDGAIEQPIEDSEFSFTLAENTFSDVDEGDRLTYSAEILLEGDETASLPEWLDFDPQTRTFSGTPLNGDVGSLTVVVTATDSEGATVTDTFDLDVANVNDAPTVTNPVAAQIGEETASLSGASFTAPQDSEAPEDFEASQDTIYVTEDQPFEIVFANDTFTDVDAGDSLTYGAMLADGSPLPENMSLTVDLETGELVFSGTPGDDDVNAGGYEVVLVAMDEAGEESQSNSFFLEVENINDAPILDLNGADEEGVDLLIEGLTPGNNLMSVVDRDLTFSDLDDEIFTGAITVQLSDPYTDEPEFFGDTQLFDGTGFFPNSATNGFSESLTANIRGTNISRYYNPNNGTLFLFGEDSVANYQQVLRTVEYFNSLDSGIKTDLSLDFGITEQFDPVSSALAGVYNSEILATSDVSFDADTTASLVMEDEVVEDEFFEDEFTEGELIIADTDGGDTDDEISLSFDPDNGIIQVETNSDFSVGEGIDAINGAIEVPLGMVGQTWIDNMAGEDTLTIDLDRADEFGEVYHDIFFNIDNPQSSAQNMLTLEGLFESTDSFGVVYHDFTDDGRGISGVSSFSENHQVDLSIFHNGLESIVDELDIPRRVFSLSEAAETITLSDNDVAGDNLSTIGSDMGVAATFSSPNTALTVDAYDGNDVINVDSLDSSFAANLTIDAGNGNDTVNGGAGDEMITGGAGKDILTGGAGDDIFVFDELTESVAAGFAFDVIEDLEIGSDAILAPVAIDAEDIRDFGTLRQFSPRAASEFLAELDANEGAILEFNSRDFLVINDATAGFNVRNDAVIEITGFSGNIDELAVDNLNSIENFI